MAVNGRPPFVPTEEERVLVATMIAGGLNHDAISKCIRGGIDDKTLRKHFREEIDTAAEKANNEIAKSLFQQALDGNTTAAIWWTKSRMGWKETNINQHQGPDGGPLKLWGVLPSKE